MRRSLVIGSLIALGATAVANAAGSAPAGLRGKSVSISWSEDRVQRSAPEDPFHEVHIDRRAEIYLAPSGRVFKRESAVDDGQRMYRGRGASRSGSSDQVVGGESGQQVGVSFSGSTMLVTSVAERGARQMAVSFDPGFGSCQARIANGRERGAATYTVRSLTTGYPIEVRSGTITPGSCSVTDGNIFER